MLSNRVIEIGERLKKLKADLTSQPLPQRAVSVQPKRKEFRYHDPQSLRGFKNLLFVAKTLVEGQYAGKHKSPFRGSAPEFVDYRAYNPGDELRTIDWKAFARTDRHYIKLFEKETDMNCYLLLDTSASMNFGSKFSQNFSTRLDVSKIEYASYLTAALAYLMVKQGDKVGLTRFSNRIESHVPASGTYSHLYSILDSLEKGPAGRTTSVAEALRKSFGLFKRRGLLIVISDFLDDPEEIFKALNLFLHRRFEIILFQVLHDLELELPSVANANFIDVENGDRITCIPGDIQEGYDERLGEFLRTLAKLSRSRGIDYHLLNTQTPYQRVLQKYLLKRSAASR
ncbi:MAG: DUF58 domain-containing protein [Candidatus Omnitrophica bacterium]|nr:DUF58 domain-containing protein [Candidatus Omnitrophota bacterium]